MSVRTVVQESEAPVRIELENLQRPLTEDEAKRLIAEDPIGAAFLIMALSSENCALRQKRGSQESSASAPPSSKPVYKKPTTASGRTGKTKRGAKPGHEGRRRRPAPVIDKVVKHELPQACPHCGGTVRRRSGKQGLRIRIIEDLPADMRCETTEHHIARGCCTRCGRPVEPTVPDALPQNTIGHGLMTFVAWMRFGLGVTLSQIRMVLEAQLQTPLSDGAIVSIGHRLAKILLPWYEEIARQAKENGVLHADETGWRVLGKTHWLWCFCTDDATYYQIDRSRGSPALSKFFTEAFEGILVTDFWAPYQKVTCSEKQKCLAHLFRELDEVSKTDRSAHWIWFSRQLKDLLHDAVDLGKDTSLPEHDYDEEELRLDIRLENLLLEAEGLDNANVRRLVKRLRRYQSDVLTFLRHRQAPPTNNHAEREIRPAVILRKNTLGNQSERGAAAQAVLMTVFRTLKRRGHNPMKTLVHALRHYTLHGSLPALPEPQARQ